MKKAIDYLKELFEEPFELVEDSIEKDFYIVIRAAQEDAIRSTVKECININNNFSWNNPMETAIRESSFERVTDKLIKEL